MSSKHDLSDPLSSIHLAAEPLVSGNDADYKFLFDKLPAAAFVVDFNGTIIEVNETTRNLIGFSSDQHANEYSVQRLFQNRYNRTWLTKALQSKKPKHFASKEMQITTLDERVIDVLATVVVLPENSLMSGRAMITLVDLSAQNALEHKSGLLNSLMNNTDFIVFVLNKDHQILFANQRFADFYNIDIQDTYELCIEELLNPESLIRLQNQHQRIFLEGESASYQFGAFDENDQKTYHYTTSVFPIRYPDGQQFGAGFITQNISEKIESQKEIEQLAYYDPLTNVANRRLLQDRTEQLIANAQRSQQTFVLAFIDLDHFKEVNDIHGHEVGDKLLKVVSQRLLDCTRKGDTLSRLGGDEFVLLMPELGRRQVASKLQALLEVLQSPFTILANKLNLSASIGVVCYPDDGDTYQDLLQHADTAMYEAKAAGKNCYRFFDSSHLDKLKRRFNINAAMDRALQYDEFYMRYQPKVDMRTNEIVGCEALIRWNSEHFGRLMPKSFIPIAENSGLICEIGQWAFTRVFEEISLLQSQIDKDFNVSINLSASQFKQSDLLSMVSALVEKYKLTNIHVEIEITERTAMSDPKLSTKILTKLRQLGISVSLDDFGKGYSSLSYLKQFPIDSIKVDKSFVADIGKSNDDEVICKAIINLAHSLGMNIVAEGVETQSQADFLLSHNCNLAQGFGYHRPMSIKKLIQTLNK